MPRSSAHSDASLMRTPLLDSDLSRPQHDQDSVFLSEEIGTSFWDLESGGSHRSLASLIWSSCRRNSLSSSFPGAEKRSSAGRAASGLAACDPLSALCRSRNASESASLWPWLATPTLMDFRRSSSDVPPCGTCTHPVGSGSFTTFRNVKEEFSESFRPRMLCSKRIRVVHGKSVNVPRPSRRTLAADRSPTT